MRDWVADWKKWSPVERVVAIALLLLISLGVPLGLMITGGKIGV